MVTLLKNNISECPGSSIHAQLIFRMSTALLNLLFAQTIFKQLTDLENSSSTSPDASSTHARNSPSPPAPEFFIKLSQDLKLHPLNSDFNLSPQACQSLYNALLPQNPTHPTGAMLRPLLGKLYESYKKDIVERIREDEMEYRTKLKEIEQIERGVWDGELLKELDLEQGHGGNVSSQNQSQTPQQLQQQKLQRGLDHQKKLELDSDPSHAQPQSQSHQSQQLQQQQKLQRVLDQQKKQEQALMIQRQQLQRQQQLELTQMKQMQIRQREFQEKKRLQQRLNGEGGSVTPPSNTAVALGVSLGPTQSLQRPAVPLGGSDVVTRSLSPVSQEQRTGTLQATDTNVGALRAKSESPQSTKELAPVITSTRLGVPTTDTAGTNVPPPVAQTTKDLEAPKEVPSGEEKTQIMDTVEEPTTNAEADDKADVVMDDVTGTDADASIEPSGKAIETESFKEDRESKSGIEKENDAEKVEVDEKEENHITEEENLNVNDTSEGVEERNKGDDSKEIKEPRDETNEAPSDTEKQTDLETTNGANPASPSPIAVQDSEKNLEPQPESKEENDEGVESAEQRNEDKESSEGPENVTATESMDGAEVIDDAKTETQEEAEDASKPQSNSEDESKPTAEIEEAAAEPEPEAEAPIEQEDDKSGESIRITRSTRGTAKKQAEEAEKEAEALAEKSLAEKNVDEEAEENAENMDEEASDSERDETTAEIKHESENEEKAEIPHRTRSSSRVKKPNAADIKNEESSEKVKVEDDSAKEEEEEEENEADNEGEDEDESKLPKRRGEKRESLRLKKIRGTDTTKPKPTKGGTSKAKGEHEASPSPTPDMDGETPAPDGSDREGNNSGSDSEAPPTSRTRAMSTSASRASKKRKRTSSPLRSSLPNRRFLTMVNPLLSNISSNKSASFFANPVNPNDAPNYYSLIYDPTDIRTIKSQVKDGRIKDTAELERELQRMFANAVMYNGWDSDVSVWTREMQHETETLLALFRGAERTSAVNSMRDEKAGSVSDEGQAEKRRKK